MKPSDITSVENKSLENTFLGGKPGKHAVNPKAINLKEMDKQLNEQLMHLENNIGTATAHELAERRQFALEAVATPYWQRWALPSAGAAFASLLLLAVFLSPLFPSGSPSVLELNREASSKQLTENIELYEDLEFYFWLANSELNESS